MASFSKTKSGNFLAEIRRKRKGHDTLRLTRTFDTQREALAWADETEASIREMDRSGRVLPTRMSLEDALKQWQSELKKHIEEAPASRQRTPEFARLTKSVAKDKSRVKLWAAHRLAVVPLRDITQNDIEQFIDDRREDEKSDSTITNDLALLNRLFEHVCAATRPDLPSGWRWKLDNPIPAAKKDRSLQQSRNRERRLTADEYISATEIVARTSDQPVVIARYATLEEAEAALPTALDMLSGKQIGEVETAPAPIPEAPPTPTADAVTVQRQPFDAQAESGQREEKICDLSLLGCP